jgi:hydroxymethylpyrimidine/phosphomethylpyrimidine kinase
MSLVAEQLEAVLSDVEVRAVKIGMLANGEIVRAVASALRRHPPPFVVLDPVICSTSGARLLSDDGIDALRHELLPLVTLVTPNAAEAGVLARSDAPASVADARLIARQIRAGGASNVLVTGGHVATDESVVDVLSGKQGDFEFSAIRVSVDRTHGTGCRLSSAIASHVALGGSMKEACARAQRYVADWLSDQSGAGQRSRV